VLVVDVEPCVKAAIPFLSGEVVLVDSRVTGARKYPKKLLIGWEDMTDLVR
jgi:hypothetical protein